MHASSGDRDEPTSDNSDGQWPRISARTSNVFYCRMVPRKHERFFSPIEQNLSGLSCLRQCHFCLWLTRHILCTLVPLSTLMSTPLSMLARLIPSAPFSRTTTVSSQSKSLWHKGQVSTHEYIIVRSKRNIGSNANVKCSHLYRCPINR